MGKLTHKTIAALAASVVLVAFAAVLTTAAVVQPRVLGLNDSTRADNTAAGASATAGTQVPSDAGATPGGSKPSAATDPRDTDRPTTPAPAAPESPQSLPPVEAPAPPVTIVSPSPPPSTNPSIAPVRPSPSIDCREPEWDPERSTWYCSDDEADEVADD